MKNFSTALNEVLVARNEKAPSADLVTSINNAKSHAKALDQLFSSKAFSPVAKKLLSSLSITSAKDNREDFVAVKVVVKIISAANAIAKNDTALLDPYSRHIVQNLVKLQGISNKSALVALSRAIVYTDDEAKANLIAKYDCSAGTAGTQASSTRMMLKNLDMVEVLKGKRGDVMTIKTNDCAAALIGLITGKPVALKAEPAKAPVKKPAAAPKAATVKKPAAEKATPVKKTTTAKKAVEKAAEKPAAAKKTTTAKKAPKAA